MSDSATSEIRLIAHNGSATTGPAMLDHVRHCLTRLRTVMALLPSFCSANDSRTHITSNNVN